MNKINIRLQGNAWVACHEGPHRGEIVDLFGTPIVPTAYTIAMPREQVVMRIQKLNPAVLVY